MNILGFDITITQMIVAVAVCLVVLFLLSRLLKRPKVDKHTERTKCSCGWSGVVSRFSGECPKCGNKLGSRIASS
jgi:hypothetical protein